MAGGAFYYRVLLLLIAAGIGSAAEPTDNSASAPVTDTLPAAQSDLDSLLLSQPGLPEPPTIVLAGHHNDGKSALLEAYLGLRLTHVGASVSTRRPLRVHCQHDPDYEEPVFFLTRDGAAEEERVTVAEVRAYVEAENARLTRAGEIEETELRVRVRWRSAPNVVLIDTPGLLSLPSGGSAVADASLVKLSEAAERCLQRALAPPSRLCLCLEDTSDWQLSPTAAVVSRFDPMLSRTFLVATKLDGKLAQFSMAEDLHRLLDPPQLKQQYPRLLGGPIFTAVPPTRTADPAASAEAIAQSEAKLRKRLHERLGSHEYAPRIGVHALRSALQPHVDNRWAALVGDVSRAIDCRLNSLDDELRQGPVGGWGGSALETEDLEDFAHRFCQAVHSLLTGTISISAAAHGETLLQEQRASASGPLCQMRRPSAAHRKAASEGDTTPNTRAGGGDGGGGGADGVGAAAAGAGEGSAQSEGGAASKTDAAPSAADAAAAERKRRLGSELAASMAGAPMRDGGGAEGGGGGGGEDGAAAAEKGGGDPAQFAAAAEAATTMAANGADDELVFACLWLHASQRLYGGAQFWRALEEFMLGASQAVMEEVSIEEIVNAMGVDGYHDGCNYMRAVCVLVIEKARGYFDTSLGKLRLRMLHIMGRLSGLADHLMLSEAAQAAAVGAAASSAHAGAAGPGGGSGGAAGAFTGAHGGAEGHAAFTRPAGVFGGVDDVALVDGLTHAQYMSVLAPAYQDFVNRAMASTMAMCANDVSSMTRYVSWDFHSPTRDALHNMLVEPDIASYEEMVEGFAETLMTRRVTEPMRLLMNDLVKEVIRAWREEYVRAISLKLYTGFLLPFLKELPNFMRKAVRRQSREPLARGSSGGGMPSGEGATTAAGTGEATAGGATKGNDARTSRIRDAIAASSQQRTALQAIQERMRARGPAAATTPAQLLRGGTGTGGKGGRGAPPLPSSLLVPPSLARLKGASAKAGGGGGSSSRGGGNGRSASGAAR